MHVAKTALAVLIFAWSGASAEAASLTAEALRTALAPRLLAQAERDPAAFARKISFLAGAYGSAGGIGAEGFDRMGLVMRARLRAEEGARLMAADLDGDGEVSAAERTAVEPSFGAARRKRFAAAWTAADGDHSGSVTAAEARAAGAAAADKAMAPDRLAEWKTLLVMDANGDGLLSSDEASAGVALLGPGKAAATAEAGPDAGPDAGPEAGPEAGPDADGVAGPG